MDENKIHALMEVFHDADEATARFRKDSGLACEQGCGRCCENPDVETTVLEMLPGAMDLWSHHKADAILEKLARLDGDSSRQCVFYQPDPFVAGHGRCSAYSFRPLVCRLFGFSAWADKHGRDVIVTCPTIKRRQAKKLEKARQEVQKENMRIPRMTDYAMKIFGIDPGLGEKKIPINAALKIALEKVGMILNFEELSCNP